MNCGMTIIYSQWFLINVIQICWNKTASAALVNYVVWVCTRVPDFSYCAARLQHQALLMKSEGGCDGHIRS